MKNRKLLCCDWGTSNFRLYLVDNQSKKTLGKVKANQGIATTFNQWKTSTQKDRIFFFRSFLNIQIQRLATTLKESLNHIPVVLSGMASSSIGMSEVPYSNVPFSIDQPKLSFQHFPASPIFSNELFLYGGLKTAQDVMRGEEVQLLGLTHLMDQESCVCLLPGTHSKHIWIENKTVIDFQTFMTGECFQLITEQSILKKSINISHTFGKEDHSFFQEGIIKAQNSNILNSLFSVRTNTLLKGVSKEHNYYYLSGLLIGQELKALLSFEGQLLLNCSNDLSKLYQLALKTLQLDKKLTTISTQDMEQCIPIAHLKLFQQS